MMLFPLLVHSKSCLQKLCPTLFFIRTSVVGMGEVKQKKCRKLVFVIVTEL